MRSANLGFLVLLCMSGLPGLAAQGSAKSLATRASDKLLEDPYTKGEAAAMKKAGYVAIGKMPWGDDHDSLDIQKALPTVPLRFIETEHFRVCSALGAMPWPKKSVRRRSLEKELKDLKARIPNLKYRRGKPVDPWVRAHLFAARLERVYANLCQHLKVDADSFDREKILAAHQQNKTEGKPQFAEGPHFGMRGKFLVLLLNKHGNLVRYARRARMPNPGVDLPQTHFFFGQGSLLCGTYTELEEGLLKNDHALHCHTIFLASQCMAWGFMGFQFRPPAWLVQGLAMGEVHRVDPRQHSFRKLREGQLKEQIDGRWARHVRSLVKKKAVRPLGELWQDFGTENFGVLDLMCIWSRVDYLIQAEPDKFRAFFQHLKRRIPVAPNTVPTKAEICAQQLQALKSAFGTDPAGFDAGWSDFVLKNYPRR